MVIRILLLTLISCGKCPRALGSILKQVLVALVLRFEPLICSGKPTFGFVNERFYKFWITLNNDFGIHPGADYGNNKSSNCQH